MILLLCVDCVSERVLRPRFPSVIKGANALPPEDPLLRFLVDNSADSEQAVQCANCDHESDQKDTGGMFFCNTCAQPLCGACRETTHRARMFSHHDIVSLAKRAKGTHRKCSLHEEPYILFSTEKKSMLCIKCFRDMQGENRTHCIDIETAYAQGCEMLDQAVLAVKELQTSTREAIVLLSAMIGEVCHNVEEEESAICSLFNSLQEKLAERKKLLLKAAQSQHEEKEKALKEQLSHLAALLPTLQVHLVTCSAFLCSANKFEFLDMGYQLMERLKRIVKLPHRLRPVQSSKINTDFRSEFARCLESFLLIGPRCPASIPGSSSMAVRTLSGQSIWYSVRAATLGQIDRTVRQGTGTQNSDRDRGHEQVRVREQEYHVGLEQRHGQSKTGSIHVDAGLDRYRRQNRYRVRAEDRVENQDRRVRETGSERTGSEQDRAAESDRSE
ncbi:unnamed protein product [Boreogadus saida]